MVTTIISNFVAENKKREPQPSLVNLVKLCDFYLYQMDMISFMMKSFHNMSLLFCNNFTYNETCLAKRQL